ncbi:hypothetical protein PLESTB_001170500 [Pleodorina starrii]|uniref:PH domain-containing protein n=1 Tax=Pleodorina starrii TaxID=330485 RepID=A0A9W6F5Y6_9CHLO|nr:hypothetical protein PLESTB_001170500 [Pleodorina starrii]GLC64819.1 hypothetical protein PLESTF_000210800 [Pleodorina starrii]
MASDFKGISEKFRMNLVHHDGQSDRVVVQIGLDGLKLLSASDNRTMRSYDLSHISRWQSRGGSLILYTRTPVDVEERQTTLSADDNTVRSALDTLTCCCMQLAELLQSRQTETAQETANNLHALVVGGGRKKTPLPSADEVEYWRSPDKAGWLQSQGEHIKNWRNRWFVLKQGYLFRFYNDKVTESVKPRGVVDLSKVQDVRVLPGRANTIQLKTTSGGAVAYIAGSETEVVEWVSAIEGAMQKIVRHIAGVDEEAAATAGGRGASSRAAAAPAAAASKNPAEWLRQMERNFESSSAGGGGGGGGGGRASAVSNRNLGSTMVSVVGYDDVPSSSSGGGGGGGGGYRDTYRDTSPYSSLNRQYSGSYTPIQGTAAIAGAQVLTSDLDLNYGGGGGGGGGGGLMPQSGYGQPQQQQQQAPRQSYAPAMQQQQPQQQAPRNGSGVYGAAQPYGQPYGYAQQAPPPQQAPAVSLIDQVPSQQPAYPTYFQQPAVQVQQPQVMAAPQQVATSAPGGWQVHYTAEGRPYYYNGATGVTQWEAPAGYA